MRAGQSQPDAGPTLGRRERNKQEKLRRIIGAARELFRRQGFAATTTQQIADAADIAAGTLFLYAKSKEDLVVLVFNTEMKSIVADAPTVFADHAGLLDRVLAVFRPIIDYHDQDVELARVLIRELTFLANVDRREEVAHTRDLIEQTLAATVEQAQKEGLCKRKVDVVRLSQVLFSLYYQQLQAWLSGFVDRAAFERNLRERIEFVLAPYLKRTG